MVEGKWVFTRRQIDQVGRTHDGVLQALANFEDQNQAHDPWVAGRCGPKASRQQMCLPGTSEHVPLVAPTVPLRDPARTGA